MLDETVEILSHPHVRIGLGDGGAHLQIFSEASCPTFAIAHFTRDRTHGPKCPVEEMVKMWTRDSANLVGLDDRGEVKVGLRADLNIIDFERLKLCEPYIASDLPTGAKRWIQKSEGYELTMCNGVVTYENGRFVGALPGRLVRSPLRGKLDVRTLEQISSALLDMMPEPRSTHDTLVKDADLRGGASATVRALNKNMADLVSAAGDFFSGKMVKGVSRL
jgi:N-acyl-D-aspartate/D-glutamate deacylase